MHNVLSDTALSRVTGRGGNSLVTAIHKVFLYTFLFSLLVSFGIAQESSSAGGNRRTAGYNDWVNSLDSKGKQASVKRKADKVFFKATITVATTSNSLLLDFGMLAKGAVTRGTAKTETLATFDGKKLNTTLSTATGGETIQIDGIGYSGKLMKLKYQWGKAKAVTLKLPGDYLINTVGLPMPTLHNVGEELFPKGFGQNTPYFANGLVVGVPQGSKGARSVIHKTYADVLKSMSKKIKTGVLMHTGTARCLDSLGKKLFDKQQKTLPPDKMNNRLFGEALTMKLNIAASATGKFPTGFGEEEYYDMGSPFHHMLISQVSTTADSVLSCLPISLGAITPSEMADVLEYANEAYANSPYTIDTLSFAGKTQLKPLYLAGSTARLRPSGVAPKIFTGEETFNALPKEFALNQNFPNPFNPTTQLSFEIGQKSIVTMKVFNLLGQEVATLIDKGEYESGAYDVDFDASNLTSGIYFYRITVDQTDANGTTKTFSDVKRMTLVK